MKEIRYDFVELESDESFATFSKAFLGTLSQNAVLFDNPVVKGELIKKTPEHGLWIRKWKLTVFQKVLLHRDSAPATHEQKFSLVYFLNPSLFDLKKELKKWPLNSKCNTLFLSNAVSMDFRVLPKQPFYVLDITFTLDWLLEQFREAEPDFKAMLSNYLASNKENILAQPCQAADYKVLNELDLMMQTEGEDVLFIRSRIYQLLSQFFNRLTTINTETKEKQPATHYDQVIQAEAILMQHLQKAPTIKEIAQTVNLSASSLLRQFKIMYGKSLQDYYIEKKMELAKKMIIENGISVKQAAQALGYKQGSPFIETFKKQYGYSPGTLKV